MYYEGWSLHCDARCTTKVGRSIMTHDVLQRLVALLWRTMYHKHWSLHYDVRCSDARRLVAQLRPRMYCEGWSLRYDPGCTGYEGWSLHYDPGCKKIKPSFFSFSLLPLSLSRSLYLSPSSLIFFPDLTNVHFIHVWLKLYYPYVFISVPGSYDTRGHKINSH